MKQMKEKGITVIRRLTTKVGMDEAFKILVSSHMYLDYVGPFSFDDFLGSIDEHKPE